MSKKRINNKSKKFKKSFKKEVNIKNIAEKEQGVNFIESFKNKVKEKKSNVLNFIKNGKENSFSSQIKFFLKKISVILKKWNNVFCSGMTCKTNIKRDVIIISFAIVLSAVFLLMGQYVENIKSKVELKKEEVAAQGVIEENFELENINEIKLVQDQISSENWKEYKSAWYGFKIKYPQNWKVPAVKPLSKFSKAIYRVSFLSDNPSGNFIGFDVAIYDIAVTRELAATDEFPKIKEASVLKLESCQDINSHVIETGNYSAEEIYIPSKDDCHDSALFFSVIDGQYIYNITPIVSETVKPGIDLMVELTDKLPEFFVAVSSFENIDIVRPKAVPKPAPKPKITAPMPASYKVDQFGRLVCEKKNDKPSKSTKNKKKHLDMECCLDPDEYPNPHCYYDPGKYGKYFK